VAAGVAKAKAASMASAGMALKLASTNDSLKHAGWLTRQLAKIGELAITAEKESWPAVSRAIRRLAGGVS